MRIPWIPAALAAGLALGACSSSGGYEDVLRPERIRVYELNAGDDLSVVILPVEGIEDGEIHVVTDVDVDITYEASDPSWLTIDQVERTAADHYVVHYTVPALSNPLDRRYGMLNIAAPSLFLGSFVTLQQGYSVRYAAPSATQTLQAGESWTSAYAEGIRSDYNDFIAFNAWAPEGSSSNRLLVEIIGEGTFRDTGQRSRIVEVPAGKSASAGNWHYFRVHNDGERMDADFQVRLSAADAGEAVRLQFARFKIYRITTSQAASIEDDNEVDEGQMQEG